MRRTFTVNRGDARRRLDQMLLDRLPAYTASRTRLQQWIRLGQVRIDGARADRVSQRLLEGQRIEIELPDPPLRQHDAQPLPIDILYEDAWLLAVHKPAGMVAHPTKRYPDGTLMNALLWYLQQQGGVGGDRRADGRRARQSGDDPPAAGAAAAAATPVVRLVHRLDRETSGVMLVARTREVHARLARAMARRLVEKQYLALVYGVPASARDRIDLRITRDASGRFCTSKVEGRTASTIVELLAVSTGACAGLSLLRCTLVTGRLHQIRVHLAGVGLPIVGDPVYGEPRWKGLADQALAEACAGLTRQALHAWRLRCAHPVPGQPALELTAPPPPDLQSLLERAGLASAAGLPSR